MSKIKNASKWSVAKDDILNFTTAVIAAWKERKEVLCSVHQPAQSECKPLRPFFSCGQGYFKDTLENMQEACVRGGHSCPDGAQCICMPCKKVGQGNETNAFEAFLPLLLVDYLQSSDYKALELYFCINSNPDCLDPVQISITSLKRLDRTLLFCSACRLCACAHHIDSIHSFCPQGHFQVPYKILPIRIRNLCRLKTKVWSSWHRT